ncbi:MAG: arginine--tRNA ligase [Sphaerochaetaceae bacterium]
MKRYKEIWKTLVEREILLLSELTEIPSLTVQKPPSSEMGEIAFPLFAYAKVLKTSPAALATELKKRLEQRDDLPKGELLALGPYLNVRLDLQQLASTVHAEITQQHSLYGTTSLLQGQRIMVEFSCPNTNKPLHLGHLRNDAIGQSIANILKANGAEVYKVNLINNRGVHICKSMLAYQKFGNNETPSSSGIKGDHLVGDYYVRFASWEKEDPSAGLQAQQMLKKWEQGDAETLALWEKMNSWTLEGIQQTYQKTGVSFDRYYYESETYSLGKDMVLQGLQQGVFYEEEDGSIWVDLTAINLDKKVLLRKDGTSLYVTQDLGTAVARHNDWPFDSQIYVVANEQSYHFKVLFHILEKLGFSWARNLHHLAYGMVNLPEGKMKSREGTVVDADDLIEELTLLAKAEIVNKERQNMVDDVDATAANIALGALNYFLLQVNPMKDMVFNPDESISFTGNTGPYLQYMGARISSMMRLFAQNSEKYEKIDFDPAALCLEEERELLVLVASFSEVVETAAVEFNPSAITGYLYELSRLFSRYYHDHPILKAASPSLVKARIELVAMVLQVLKNAYALLGIPFLESM